MKYILQTVNVYTGDILGVNNLISNYTQLKQCIKGYEDVERNRNGNHSDIVLLDSEKRMWDAEYVIYTVDESKMDEGVIIYNALFKVKSREKKAVI